MTSDYSQDNRKLVEQLGNSLNPGIEHLYQALNKRLTVADNLQGSERDVDIQVDAAGNLKSQTFITVDQGVTVRNVFIGKADNLVNPRGYPTSAPFISWSNTPTGIEILNIKGLLPNQTYRLRLILLG